MKANTQLKKTLGLGSLILFGLAYMAPMIVFGTYGVIYKQSGGQVASSYVVAMIAMLFTAIGYAVMAKKIPESGSSYGYVSKTFGTKFGFLIGWVILLDYLFLPMVIWLIGGVYLEAYAPSIPGWFWLVAFIVLTTGLNIVGFGVAKKVNLVLMILQLAVIIAFCALAMMMVSDPSHAAVVTTTTAPTHPHVSLVFVGAAIACYSFLGFDAVSTMAEETENPVKNVPKAIIWVTVIGGVIFAAASFIMSTAFPDISIFNSDSAAADMAKQVGGIVFSSIFVATLVIAQFTSGLSAQAGASRLIYAMGRDGVLPNSWFGGLHERFKTPYVSILLVGVVGFLALKLSVTTSTSFINFGAFLAFMFVNLCAVVSYFRMPQSEKSVGTFLTHVAAPVLGILCILKLLVSLDEDAITLGLCWLTLGVCIMLFLLKRGAKLELEIK
ncbi:APC family permease [Marinomonas spartinae]|uniref:APC family permease n=1 Tax=Marinomonas spartinae TaxID=1792290 RepID=UPI0018F21E33|nr:APC family permease [Marinomonas spartinae]MBJ7555508.1 amino acid permease [Marinomonas spartinae]